MSSIYFHIPFCKQACHYCDFHFSTNRAKQGAMVAAIAKELRMRSGELKGGEVRTIYFGGGTPSLMPEEEVKLLLRTINEHFLVAENPEITLEANPDDLDEERLAALQNAGVNRLSIGVQSFHDKDLQLMNRAHKAAEAAACLQQAARFFANISIDLIYGIPGASMEDWQYNLDKALSFGIPHISAYALTVEPRTALKKLIDSGKVQAPDEEAAAEQFYELISLFSAHGYEHYELSNFGKPGFFSENNLGYWQGRNYLGVGPSAHSYDGQHRSWNVGSNAKYLKAIGEDTLPGEEEELSLQDRYNEYVMTGLRTMWGISPDRVREAFGPEYSTYLLEQAQKFLQRGLLEGGASGLTVTKNGKFLTDGIASDLFMVNLKSS